MNRKILFNLADSSISLWRCNCLPTTQCPTEVSTLYNIPQFAVRGGAETMYPEYREKLKDVYKAKPQCERYCCGWGGGGGFAAVNLENCITGGSPTQPRE